MEIRSTHLIASKKSAQDDSPRSSKISRGFTLVELLVVIAIIAVLATLSFSIFGKVLNKSKSVKSVNQLKQIAGGIAAYTGEHNGKYPPAWYQPNNLSAVEFIGDYIYGSDYRVIETPVGIGSYLAPEQRADSVFISPFRKGIDFTGTWGHQHTYGPHPNVMVSISNDSQANGTSPRQMHESRISRPSELIIYADMWTNDKGGGAAGFGLQPGVDSSSGNLDEPIEVVLNKVGALHYYDGRLHAIMGDFSVRVFKEGEVKRRNIVLDQD